jgi:hypothetical protein
VPRTGYVLPIRWTRPRPIEELTAYLRVVATLVDEVIVVDGSPTAVFERHARRWAGVVTHIPPDRRLACANGKVHGVLTGVERATAELLVVADDDVRYDEVPLRAVFGALASADLVWPQNHFDPLPWHARWDTGRTLLNRAFGRDFPGTVGIRRSTFRAMGGYSGNVLWENLELLRTMEAGGARVAELPGCYVRRLPPTARHFVSQRVRQAYDEFARPGHLAVALATVPAFLAVRRRPRALAVAVATVAGAAEVGRRRFDGARYFPVTGSLLAPVWALERGVCAWLAVAQRLRYGGVRYSGSVIRHAATTRRELMRNRVGVGTDGASLGFASASS